jgi:hypothetical protein
MPVARRTSRGAAPGSAIAAVARSDAVRETAARVSFDGMQGSPDRSLRQV